MNLIDRAKNIVLTPTSEWQAILPESTTTAELYRGYVVPLAAIGPVAQFIGISLVGISTPFFGTYRLPFAWALSQSVVHYVLGLVGVYIISLIVNALAPTFGGEKQPQQALKVTVYAFTPAWLAGVLHLLPSIWILGLLASLYSLYVLYLGLPVLMKAPPAKAVGYTAAVVVCAFVVMLVIGAAAAAVGRIGMGGSPYATGLPASLGGAAGSRGASPSGGQLGQMTAQIHAAADQMRAAEKTGDAQAQATAATNALAAIASGGVQVDPVDQNVLKAMLPATVDGMPRISFEASKSGVGAMLVSKAEARYGNSQDRTVDLVVTDVGGARMLAAFAAWATIEEDKETDTGYEKMGKVDGRPVHETFDKRGQQGEYAVLVGERFTVDAHGSKVDIETLKRAVESVDLARLEGMKNEGVKKAN